MSVPNNKQKKQSLREGFSLRGNLLVIFIIYIKNIIYGVLSTRCGGNKDSRVRPNITARDPATYIDE